MKLNNIKIQFFEKDNQLDQRAIKGGVYLIELLKENIRIPLYVGESGAVIKRCGEHLCMLFTEPNYLGLELEDLSNSALVLRISLVESIQEKKKFWWDKNYKDKELKAIKKYNPITQLPTSDRQIKNKIEVVQSKMEELEFK